MICLGWAGSSFFNILWDYTSDFTPTIVFGISHFTRISPLIDNNKAASIMVGIVTRSRSFYYLYTIKRCTDWTHMRYTMYGHTSMKCTRC